MTDELEAVKVIISGKVQGVSFRASLKKIAQECNVVGWVRNVEDGSVEAFIQGKNSNVQRVLDWCHSGPPNARVENLVIKKERVEPTARYFVVLL